MAFDTNRADQHYGDYDGRVQMLNPKGANVTAGMPVVFSNSVLIACDDIASGAVGWWKTEGVYKVSKDTGTALAALAIAYFDVVDGVVNDDNTNNKAMGVVLLAAAETDAFCYVKLHTTFAQILT